MVILLSYIFYFIASNASPLQRRWLAKTKGGDSKNQIDFSFKITLVMVVLSLFIPLFSPLRLEGGPYALFLLVFICGVCGASSIVAFYNVKISQGRSLVVLSPLLDYF